MLKYAKEGLQKALNSSKSNLRDRSRSKSKPALDTDPSINLTFAKEAEKRNKKSEEKDDNEHTVSPTALNPNMPLEFDDDWNWGTEAKTPKPKKRSKSKRSKSKFFSIRQSSKSKRTVHESKVDDFDEFGVEPSIPRSMPDTLIDKSFSGNGSSLTHMQDVEAQKSKAERDGENIGLPQKVNPNIQLDIGEWDWSKPKENGKLSSKSKGNGSKLFSSIRQKTKSILTATHRTNRDVSQSVTKTEASDGSKSHSSRAVDKSGKGSKIKRVVSKKVIKKKSKSKLMRSQKVLSPEQEKKKREEIAKVVGEIQKKGIQERWAIPFDEIKFSGESSGAKEMENWNKFDEGAGGELFFVQWRGLKCVAKTCPLAVGKQVLVDLANEITILSALRHPNLVMFLGASFEADMAPILLMEFCPGGNLEKKLCKLMASGSKLKGKTALRYSMEMALAVNFLHKSEPPLIHRDLKPSNVLLTTGDQIKITDFGLSKYIPKKNVQQSDKYTLTGETGSYRFMAPEVFRHETYNEKVDVYSYALIVYWIYSGQRPFADIYNPIEAARAAAQGRRKPNENIIKNSAMREIMSRSWSMLPEERPDFDEILQELNKISEANSLQGCSIQ